MSYPERGASYKHEPKFIDRMLQEEKSHPRGVGQREDLRENMGRSLPQVIAPIEDTPAWRAGIKPGDRIVKINGESTKGMTLVDAVTKMRGKKGSKVTVSVFRDGFEKVKDKIGIVIKVVRHTEIDSHFPKYKPTGLIRFRFIGEDYIRGMNYKHLRIVY
mgnify:CR=1 FL=1